MKYMGSKSRTAKHIVPIIQHYVQQRGIYWEPLVGGANIIDKISAPVRNGSDISRYLIALLRYVQSGGELPDEINWEQYAAVRSNKDAYSDWYVGCVGFLASYNGRFFDGGYAGTVHTKAGTVRDYYDEAKRNLLNQMLDGIEFSCSDYRTHNPTGLVIYCDPPFAGVKQFSGRFDHAEFWSIMREWSHHNIVLISEQSAPEDFKCIWEQPVTRTIDNTKRVRVAERLFIKT